ncbi:MAG: lytic transglycosylase domain-containing protein [Sphingomonadales bacterium]|nr:MAG: lytic transglycosylase domain-containing protein [Sphingomonadales bacterium]
MSSMQYLPRRKYLFSALMLGGAGIVLSGPAATQEAASWDMARAQLVAQQPTGMAQAISRWEYLTSNDDLTFGAYSGFLLAYPDFPRAAVLQVRAERALDNEAPSADSLVAFFDRNPPVTNTARARYALALSSVRRPEAAEVARAAWRGGVMSETAEAYVLGLFAGRFTQEDNDARMEALLWQGAGDAATRHMLMTSPPKRDLFMKRLALVQDELPQDDGLAIPRSALNDPGTVYNLVKYYRKNRKLPQAIEILTSRPAFASLPVEASDMVDQMLQVARGAGSRQAVRIATSVDDLFAPDADISEGSFRLRDKYTDLVWLGGTKALWDLGDGAAAAPLFYRYGAAAKTPLTRAKGFYWAGRAARQAGMANDATRYFEMAGQYADQYYGQLALGALGKPMPQFGELASAVPSPEQRASFNEEPLVQAMRALATARREWRTERAFFEALADKADTPEEMVLMADLAATLRLEELAVVAGATAPEHGLSGFERFAHPTVQVPLTADWTMSHAIMRQESEFDQNRVSHAGARGMMQLMPGTAREQAGKIGVNYLSASLTDDPQYNIRLGDAYFRRMLDYYGGAYPLAIGAYNAGPGRVNQWLRMNGDPRTGAIDYVTWIEKIPANFETRYYIMRVLGNAVAYDNMHPQRAPGGKPRTIDDFLRR